jgi:hypothetical protein
VNSERVIQPFHEWFSDVLTTCGSNRSGALDLISHGDQLNSPAPTGDFSLAGLSCFKRHLSIERSGELQQLSHRRLISKDE